uniref:fibronectin type III domain-containing protein n=1 Tax=Halobacteriovorax sp. TaxID=2020862 RepID=UPI0035665414
ASNQSGGVGYSITANSCLGVSLASGATCDIDIKYDASESEPDSTIRYLLLTYTNIPNQYVSSGIKLDFASANPADVVVANTNSENINNSSGGVIQGSYPINFGFYTNSSHPVLNSAPFEEVTVEDITLLNSAVEKASFLLQYRTFVGNMNASLPAGPKHKIFDDGTNVVFADRPCFYGDDEGGPLPADEWGFNANTASVCKIEITKKFDDSYIGEKLQARDHNIQLSFYNSGRSSTDSMSLHFKGFLEPNKTTVVNTSLSNVVSDDQGDLSFSWDAFTPTNSAWGAVTGYRVFYSTTKSILSNVFETSASFEDTSTPSVFITGLVPGRYYYLKVVALRTTDGGKQYLSESNMGLIELISPPANTFYNYDLNIVVDKFLSPYGSPMFGNKTEVTDGCADESEQVIENGVNITKYKKLISSDVFNVINQDPSLSEYSLPGTPHWMSDPVTDIEPIFSPDFSCLDKGGSDSSNSIFYQKSCSDCSCNFLSKIEGGDGENVPPTATVYVDGDASAAAQRCYFDL